MSSAYWQIAQYAKALELAQRAMKIDSSLKEAQYNVATSMLFLSKTSEAVNILKKIVFDHPKYLAARFILAVAHACGGEMQCSTKDFKALKEAMDSRVVNMAIDDLVSRLQKNNMSEYATNLKITAANW